MFFTNKWLNLLLIILVSMVSAIIIVKVTKITDKDGKAKDDKLAIFGHSESTTPTTATN